MINFRQLINCTNFQIKFAYNEVLSQYFEFEIVITGQNRVFRKQWTILMNVSNISYKILLTFSFSWWLQKFQIFEDITLIHLHIDFLISLQCLHLFAKVFLHVSKNFRDIENIFEYIYLTSVNQLMLMLIIYSIDSKSSVTLVII